MARVVDTVREFLSGPRVIEAARILLERCTLASICEALNNAPPADAGDLLECLERLAEFQEVCDQLLGEEILGFLREGARAPAQRVRQLVARLLVGLAATESGAERLASCELLPACEALMFDEQTGTAASAAGAINAAARWPACFDAVIGRGGGEGSIALALQARLASADDTQRIRLLHLFVSLGRISAESFSALEARGVYKEVVGSFLTDDILLKLNAVELMEALGSYEAGQTFLSTEGVPTRLAAELMDPMNDASVRLCVANLLGLVMLRSPAAVATLLPNREAPLAQVVATCIDSKDTAERLCGMNVWANASTQADGLAFFLDWAPLMRDIVALIVSPQNEVCKGAMAAWTSVLQVWPPVAVAEVGPQERFWDLAMREVTPLALRNVTSKPFADVRVQTWKLLATLVRSQAATRLVMPADEVRTTLLDFTSETNYEARIAKHEFVSELVRSQVAILADFLDADVVAVLQEYAKQGANWVPATAHVTVATA